MGFAPLDQRVDFRKRRPVDEHVALADVALFAQKAGADERFAHLEGRMALIRGRAAVEVVELGVVPGPHLPGAEQALELLEREARVRPCPLVVALGPDGPGGALAGLWGARTLAFTFEGLVIGSVVYSLPFVVQPIRNAFEAVGDRPLEVAATLRASPARAFWTVAVPLARPGFLTGAVLGFAHTVGEFGVVLMIGGNIPGETKVLSVAIYDFVETLRWREANILAGGMVVFAFAVILAMMLIEKRMRRTGE